MIPLRTLIVIILISIGIIFLILFIYSFFTAGGPSEVFYNFCKITIGKLLGDFGKTVCEALTKSI